MSPLVLEPATDEDDAALRRLTAANAMGRDVAIAFCREPSWFIAAGVQGPFRQVVVGRDAEAGELACVATRAVRPGWLNGERTSVGYLADLRVEARHRGGTVLRRLFRHLRELHADGRVRIYFTMIMETNEVALATLASGRAGLPPYRDLGRFLSPAVNLRGAKPALAVPGGEIVRGHPALLGEIVDCLNRNHARRQLAPAYAASDFGSPWLHGFRVEDFHVARRSGRVVGVLGAWDQRSFKQTVIRGYAGWMAAARPVYNAAARLLGFPRYPPAGEELRSFYAAFAAVDGDDVAVFRALLRSVYNDHVHGEHPYFVIGLHERDPLAAALADYSVTPFAGRLFAVHFEDGEDTFRGLDGRVPYVELAML